MKTNSPPRKRKYGKPEVGQYAHYCEKCKDTEKEKKEKAKGPKEIVKNCKGCRWNFITDKTYEKWHSPAYCSRKCFLKHRPPKSVVGSRIEVICKTCNKKFEVKRGRFEYRKKLKYDRGNWFCSKKCQNEGARGARINNNNESIHHLQT